MFFFRAYYHLCLYAITHIPALYTCAVSVNAVLLCGDFNATPDTDVYKLVTRGVCRPRVMLPGPECKLMFESDNNKLAR